VQIIIHKTGRDGAMGSRKETTTKYGTKILDNRTEQWRTGKQTKEKERR
jgi:hypothetical protein